MIIILRMKNKEEKRKKKRKRGLLPPAEGRPKGPTGKLRVFIYFVYKSR